MATNGKNKTAPQKIAIWCAAALIIMLCLVGYGVLRFIGGRISGDFFYPYLELAHLGGHKVSDLTLLAYSHTELCAKIEDLQYRNRMLTVQAAQAAELLKENDELRRQCGLTGGNAWEYIQTEIILRDPLRWNSDFSVRHGSNFGITPGAAVLSVSPDGRVLFAGVVSSVGKNVSQVITVNNPALRVSCRLPNSGAIGMLNFGKRQSEGMAIPLGALPVYKRYSIGEAVVTTGFEKGIPGGVLIGELTSVDEVESVFSNSLQVSGLVLPAADFSKTRFLMIAKPGSGARE